MFSIDEFSTYHTEVQRRSSGGGIFALWRTKADGYVDVLYIDLNNPYIGYTVDQVEKMVERVNLESRNNSERLMGLLSSFFATYDCYGDDAHLQGLMDNQDSDMQHRAWLLHTLMTMTNYAWK